MTANEYFDKYSNSIISAAATKDSDMLKNVLNTIHNAFLKETNDKWNEFVDICEKEFEVPLFPKDAFILNKR